MATAEIKKLERRAKALLLGKEIPPGKMDLIRSLMKNREILPEERYSAIITLIQTCPDKAVTLHEPESVEVPAESIARPAPVKEPVAPPRTGAPEESSRFIDGINRKYRRYKFFRKRYLTHANNRLGIGIKKRLIPTPRLLRAIRDVVEFKERILTRLPEVLTAILNDETIEDPLFFNYLRVFRKWMMQTPLIEYRYPTLKWMNRNAFESELKDFALYFFSFQKLDIELRERMLLMVENALRTAGDLKKEPVNQVDPEHIAREKEKRNLGREKQVYEFMMLMRSFLPAAPEAESMVSAHLRSVYGLESYPGFLVMLMEALVYWREIEMRDIENYYGVAPPAVNTMEWDYSAAEVKKAGKDPESRKRKRIEALKSSLAPYEELYSMLDFKIEGRDVLLKAFEDQWKIVDKKQKDFEDIYKYDFYAFLDGCVNYFNNCFVPLLDGTVMYFEEKNGAQIEGSVFSQDYFREDLRALSQVLGDFFAFKSSNPTMSVSRDEIRQIMQGRIRSMAQMERLVGSAGSFFYRVGEELKLVMDVHRAWLGAGSPGVNTGITRRPLERDSIQEAGEKGAPIPYYDCRISGFEKHRALTRTLAGRLVIDDISGGVIYHIAAFSYQLAYECMNDDIHFDLDKRKDILREIRELTGK